MSIANDARRLHPELASLRRALHSDPEIGLDLPRTQEKVLRELRTLPLEISTGTGCSSVVGVLRGTKPALVGQCPATVLLRADMDALPLQEELDVPFASQRPGVMHACGHDLHTAMLAGAARLLSARREEFSGSVVFMFQPGEESRHGARVMIDEGVLEAAGAPADAAYALHVFSGLVPHGQFFTRPGPMLASSDEARVTINGKGGHGSAPHLARDPVAAAAELVTSLQVMVTRRFDVFDPVVVTVGFLQAGTKANIIPASATFHATVRTFTPATRQRARTEIQRLVHNVALGYDLSADVEYVEGYPPTVNDEAEVAFAVQTINDSVRFGSVHYLGARADRSRRLLVRAGPHARRLCWPRSGGRRCRSDGRRRQSRTRRDVRRRGIARRRHPVRAAGAGPTVPALRRCTSPVDSSATRTERSTMRYRKHAMVVAPQPEAAEAAIEIMRAGGTVVDAAVACALVQGVIDPLMCGLAGFGSCGIAMPQAGFYGYLDFHSPAPLAARPDMWADLVESEARDGHSFVVTGRVNEVGYQSIAVPASLRAYRDMHREYGRLPWAQVVEPAIGYAEDGWIVRPHVASFWSSDGEHGRVPNHERLKLTAGPRALYCRPDGSPKQSGDRVVNRDLGQTLRLIAQHGDEVFYNGEIAHAITEDMRRHDGLLTLEDMRRFRTACNEPLRGSYRGYRIASNRPPGGGVMLLQMLGILEHFDLTAFEHNEAGYIRVLAEVMKYATRDKDRHVGDPAFVSVPLDHMLSGQYTAELAAEVRSGRRADVPRMAAPDEHTTHVSIIDADGNCVTMTHSLGMPSGVITDGLGFMYNGCMSAFDPRPGRAGSIAPGKARFSSMAPSIVFDGDSPHLVIGAPGGTLIPNGLLQVILNALEFGMNMTEAVSAPRFSATSNAIDITNRIPRRVQRDLEAAGYGVIRSPLSYAFASVHAIRVHPDGFDGGADPGMDGMLLTV